MDFDPKEKLGIFVLIVMVGLAGFFLINSSKTLETKPFPPPLSYSGKTEERLEDEIVFQYSGGQEIPPNPFLPGKAEVAHNLPRPPGLELQGVIKKGGEKLAIIKGEMDIILRREGDFWENWEVAGVFFDHVILQKHPDGAFFFLPMRGD